MQEVAWAAVGLLAVAVFGMFGMFFYLAAKIDTVGSNLGSKVDATNSRIDNLGARLDARLDALAAQLQAHIERHAS